MFESCALSTQLFPAAARAAFEVTATAASDGSYAAATGIDAAADAATADGTATGTDGSIAAIAGGSAESDRLVPTPLEEEATLARSRLWLPTSRLMTITDATILTFSDGAFSVGDGRWGAILMW